MFRSAGYTGAKQLTKYKLPAVGDVVRTRDGRNVTVAWIAPESWMYRIHAYYEGKTCLDSWTAGSAYHAGRQSGTDLMLEPLPAADFTPGQSVKWRGSDGGWKTGVVPTVTGAVSDRLRLGDRTLVQDMTGALYLIPDCALQPYPKREEVRA